MSVDRPPVPWFDDDRADQDRRRDGENQPAPWEVFAVLGDEDRFRILRALWHAQGPVPFSTLHDRVGIRDSSRFNYHLDRLTGTFVAEREDGYDLTDFAERLLPALLAWTGEECCATQ